MRSKATEYWKQSTPIKIQALWRGYYVRYRLKLAGKGVLKRELCHNDEDMVSCEEKQKVHPFDYYAVEQDGKVWWFDQKTMIEWSYNNLDILNPFNRTPLQPSDVRRLRLLANIRKRGRTQMIHTVDEELSLEDVRYRRWLRVVQVFYEHGFRDSVHPNNFISLGYQQLKDFLNALVFDTRMWIYERNDGVDPYMLHSKRAKLHTWVKSLRHMMGTYLDDVHLSRDVAGVLLGCINDIQNPSEFVFFILTALLKTEMLALPIYG
jgi:hypothetical protein